MTGRAVLLAALAASLITAGTGRAAELFSRRLEPVEKGNRLYHQQHFDQALDRYEQAEQQLEREPRIHFNRGAALYKLGRPKDAREAFLRATGTDNPELKKKTYYNIGNTFLSEGSLRDAISYYRRSLEIDPAYDQARFNLELALRALEQQKQQQKQGDSGNDDQQGDQEQKQDQQQQDGDQQQEQQGEQEQQQSDEKQQDRQDRSEQQGEDQQQEQGEQGEQERDEKQQGEQQQDQAGQQGEQEQEQQQQQKQRDQQGDEQQDRQPDEAAQQQREAEQDQSQRQRAGQEQESDPQRQPDSSGSQPRQEPGELSRAQVKDLLDTMRENEKPFQMNRFMLPQYKRRDAEKDW